MVDPFVSLATGLLNRQEKAAQSTDPFDHTCSVTMIGDVNDLNMWDGPVARQLVTIGYLDGHAGLSDESLQAALAASLDTLAPNGEMILPLVAVLEQSRAGACYTILCCLQDEESLERFDWASHAVFEHLVSENGLAPDCLRVATMSVSGVEEVTHLLLRAAGRDGRSHERSYRRA